jgi:hypothetical protein
LKTGLVLFQLYGREQPEMIDAFAEFVKFDPEVLRAGSRVEQRDRFGGRSRLVSRLIRESRRSRWRLPRSPWKFVAAVGV